MGIITELNPVNFKGPVTFYGDVKANSQSGFPQRVEYITDTLGVSVEIADLIPAGSLVLGVTTRVLYATTPVTFRVGDAYNNYEWGIAVSGVENSGSTIANFTVTSPQYYTTATSVWLTPNAAPFTAGTVMVRVTYIQLAAPAPGV